MILDIMMLMKKEIFQTLLLDEWMKSRLEFFPMLCDGQKKLLKNEEI